MNYSEISAGISALCALISLCALLYSNHKNEIEKKHRVRPMFYSQFLRLGDYELNIKVKQLYNICSNLDVKWESTDNDNLIEIIKYYESECDFIISLKYEDWITKYQNTNDLSGNVIINYKNIYGNEEQCKIGIDFKQKNYERNRYFEVY